MASGSLPLFKRIDENRELLELMWRECPEFLSSHQWIEGWIRGNDDFFNELREILQSEADARDGLAGTGSTRPSDDGYAIRHDASLTQTPGPVSITKLTQRRTRTTM